MAAVAATDPQVLLCDLSSAGLGPIAPNANVPLNFQVTVASPGPYALNATVSGVTGEVNTTNNIASTTLTAVSEPDATPTITGPASVTVGSAQTLAVTIANVGTVGDVQDGTASITLPPGVRLSGPAPAGCSAASAAPTDPQVVVCDLSSAGLGPLPPGGQAQLSLPVLVSAAGTYVVSVDVASVTYEVVTTNNAASMSLVATAAPQPPAVQPVPGLSMAALAALSGVLAGVGLRRRRRS